MNLHRTPSALLLTCLPLLLLAACGDFVDGSPVARAVSLDGAPPAGAASEVAIDPHHSGRSETPGLAEVRWGRLVDVRDLDPAGGEGELRLVDLVIDPGLRSDGVDYLLERVPASGRDVLTVLHPAGTPGWRAALDRARAHLTPIRREQNGDLRFADGSVPRDAVIVLRFDDLLDLRSLTPDAVQLLAQHGTQRIPARVVADAHHGGWLERDGRVELHPTRLLVDASVSQLDSLRTPAVAAVDERGLPASSSRVDGLELRLAGSGLANHAGHRVAAGGGRFFRAASTDEEYGGLLSSAGEPRILGRQAVTLLRVTLQPGGDYRLAWRFGTKACLTRVNPGDVLVTSTAMFEVLPSTPVYQRFRGVVGRVEARVVAGNATGVGPGSPAEYVSPFAPDRGDPPECFVRFSRIASAPAAGVDPSSVLSVLFSEPMDPTTVEALDSFTIRRTAGGGPLEQFVVAQVQASPGGREFTLVPVLALDHAAGQAESYRVEVTDRVRSVAALPVRDPLPPTAFTLDPNAAPADSSALALRFGAVDENGDGHPEVRGQFLYDLSRGRVRPRPVTRFSAEAGPSNPIVGAMVPLPTGLTEPLNPLGAKVSTVWRHHDLGLDLLDESTHNLDVEGLNWSPASAPAMDAFQRFRIALAHCEYLPDEALTTGLLPRFPASGLVPTFASNAAAPLEVVHAKALGYSVLPADQFLSASGQDLMPWPLNRGVSPAQFRYYTWRDTAITEVGAPNGLGADTLRFNRVTGGGLVRFYREGQVPTIALPLLMEFRCYADNTALGNNSLRSAIAINSSARPYFRSVSGGGVLANGTVKVVDPDQEAVASGSVQRNTGQPTAPQDNAFQFGQADFVVRVSRLHTIWLDTGTSAPAFGSAVVEPSGALLPAGTRVEVHWRGAMGFNSTGSPWLDAANFDPYGDGFTALQLNQLGRPQNLAFTPAFLNGDPGWKDRLEDLDGARWVQARVSFVSDTISGRTPDLSALGIPFLR